MVTKKKVDLPADEDIDTSDIPETDFSGGVRGKYYERATGKPLPEAVRLLNTAEAKNRRLRAALVGLYEATHDYLNEFDHSGRMAEGSARLNAALADAFEALGEG